MKDGVQGGVGEVGLRITDSCLTMMKVMAQGFKGTHEGNERVRCERERREWCAGDLRSGPQPTRPTAAAVREL